MKENNEIIDLSDSNDFGFSTIDPIGTISIQDHEHRIDKMMNKIMPLLENLMKDPDKDIHWPNRDKIIKKYIADLEGIAYGTTESNKKQD